ncbi:MAG: hypothetical protein M3349_02755 [Actinomycetota bacterium]|nr:hypothetical protein [Actinomycetota bacterium]
MASVPVSNSDGPGGIVLTDSPDVIDSIGRPGLLTSRSGEPVAVSIEPSVRSDVLVQRLRGGDVDPPSDAPAAVVAWLGAATASGMTSAKVAAISLAAELADSVYRHRHSGLLFQVGEGEGDDPDPETGRWLTERCKPVGPIDENATAANLARVVGLLGDTRLVVYNLSTYVPDGDDIESAIAFGDRAQRLDLALATVAGEYPIVVVDADRIVAELGAGDHVIAPGRYSAEAANDISEEAVGQVDALGVLDPMASELSLLVIPRYDRRTTAGSITRWHKAAGDAVDPGDLLFDIAFGGLTSRLGATKDVKTSKRVMTLGVVAAEAGHILHITSTAEVSVGDRVAVIGVRPDLDPGTTDELTPHFRVGLRVMER